MNPSKNPYKFVSPTIQQEVATSSEGPKKRVLRIQDHYLTTHSERTGPSTSYLDEEGVSYHQRSHRQSNRRSHSPSPKRRRTKHGSRENYEDYSEDRNVSRRDQNESDRYSTSISPKFSHSPEDQLRHSESPDNEYFQLNRRENAEFYNPFERERSESPYYRKQRSSYTRELEYYSERRAQTPLHYQHSKDKSLSRHYEERSPSCEQDNRRSSSQAHNYNLEEEDDEDWDGKGSYAVHRLSKLIYNSPTYEKQAKSRENKSIRPHDYQHPENPNIGYEFPPPYSPDNMDDEDDDASTVNKQPNITPAPSINNNQNMTPKITAQNVKKPSVLQTIMKHYTAPTTPPQNLPKGGRKRGRGAVNPKLVTQNAAATKTLPRLTNMNMMSQPQSAQKMSQPQSAQKLPQPQNPQKMMLQPQVPQQPPAQRMMMPQTTATQKMTMPHPTAPWKKSTAVPQNRLRKRKKVNTRLMKIPLTNGKLVLVPPFIGLRKKTVPTVLNQPVDTLKTLNLFTRDTYVK